MNTKKIIGLMVIFTCLFMTAHMSSVFAGAGPEPGANATILETKVWGVITMYCTGGPTVDDLVILRVKRVDDCNVETEIYVDAAWPGAVGCPALGDTAAFDDWALEGYTFFSLPGTPYVTKVKNMVQQISGGVNATSVEAQFGFYQ